MIFLDSSDIQEVQDWMNAGVIRGVTTNPTILKKDGVVKKDIQKIITIICDIAFPYPVSVEITTQGFYTSMLVEAKEKSKWAPNINIKVPIHGPDGESNLGLINELSENRVRTNITACMNAQQLFLANLAGAAYVSLFGGRVADMGHSVENEIERYKTIRDRMPINVTGTIDMARLIVGSVREPANVMTWLAAGADIITITPDILEKMLIHPRTKETVAQFLEDAK